MWFSDNYGNERMPKLAELEELMVRNFGPISSRTNKWMNVKIINREDVEDEIEEIG